VEELVFYYPLLRKACQSGGATEDGEELEAWENVEPAEAEEANAAADPASP
jgi:hypothetical protein